MVLQWSCLGMPELLQICHQLVLNNSTDVVVNSQVGPGDLLEVQLISGYRDKFPWIKWLL